MLFDKTAKLLPIADFTVLLQYCPRFGFDITCLCFALEPQVNRVATDIEQLARLTLLETVQLNRLHDFLPEIITVSFSH